MVKPGDRRASIRMPLVSMAHCNIVGTGKQHSGALRNISISGLFMEMAECPAITSQCDIDIVFQGDHSRLMIEKVGGVIVRIDEEGVAVHFEKRLEWFILIPLLFHKVTAQSKRERSLTQTSSRQPAV